MNRRRHEHKVAVKRFNGVCHCLFILYFWKRMQKRIFTDSREISRYDSNNDGLTGMKWVKGTLFSKPNNTRRQNKQ